MYISKAGAADISQAAGTDMWRLEAPAAGKIKVDGCFINWTEATGAMTVDGVVSLKVDGVEVGTCTPADSNTIGDSDSFVVDGTTATAANPYVAFEAGDIILVEIGTQATVNTTGDGLCFLDVEFATS